MNLRIFYLMVMGGAMLAASCGKGAEGTSDGNATDVGTSGDTEDPNTSDACDDVTACQHGDGCCPEACTGANDEDCICDYTIDISTPAAVFRATFESGSTEPDVSVGTSPALLAEQGGGALVAVENPAPDVCNPSDYVLQATTPSGYTRAEYQSPRFPTRNHGYIYTWREYIPAGFFDNITMSWQARAQWKTWPCGTGQPTDVADQLCGGGGIFNDFDVNGHLGTFRFRTLPDCNDVLVSTADYLGKWSTYVVEVYWSQWNDGYYRVFQNGRMLAHETGVKTLYDGFVEGECDVSFAGGLYNTWESDNTERITAYFDDYAIFDLDAGIELSDVCPTCAAQTEITSACAMDDTFPVINGEVMISNFENSCDWNVGTLDAEEKVEGNTSLRWSHQLETWLELTYPAGASVRDFSNGGNTADSLSFWVHNNLEEPDNFMVLLMYSANPATDGDDYFSVRVSFDFTGWQHIVVPRSEIGVVRSPLGWDQIDRVMFSINGWDTVANPERVLHLDALKFTDTPES